ncbi:MAG: hypothetical protein WD646_05240 [Actinomycetota bacterium]
MNVDADASIDDNDTVFENDDRVQVELDDLEAFAGSVVLARLSGWDWPLLGSFGSATAVLTAVGLGMCIAGGKRITATSTRGTFFGLTAAFGFAALALSVTGLITGTRGPFVALGVTMLVLWVLTTLGHTLGKD